MTLPHEGYTVILDLDDTVANMRYPLQRIMNEHTGLDLHWQNWKSLTAEDVYGVSSEEFFDIAIRESLVTRMLPHDDSEDFLWRLRDAGVTINFLTARSWLPDAQEVTEEWLKYHELQFDNVIVCNVEDNKYDYIQGMEKVLFVVDDSVRHCNGYNAMTVNRPEFVFGYTLPWNKNKMDEGVIQIGSLDDIGYHIKGL